MSRMLDLAMLDVVGVLLAGRSPRLDALVVVVDRDRQGLLGDVLTDDVLLEEVEDLARLGQVVEPELAGLGELLLDDLVAQVDALVTDVDAGPAMSFLTCFWDLPQKEHFSKSPDSPTRATNDPSLTLVTTGPTLPVGTDHCTH
jgi:hypothetical protein